ncbi:unnamed protein product [Adineta steineri]|uniref:Uncharacterized protein n=1 Tax=Adineta steineri TaxID=433720 RepID=A0A820CAN6_9BILA|nr:unnamed protein product [Adineta steineri]
MKTTSTEVTTSIFGNISNINSSYIPCDPLKFSNYTGYSTRIDSYAISTGYLDGDSFLDIVVANKNDTIISIYYGFGNGTFESQKLYKTAYDVAVRNMNNDNISDIILTYTDSNKLPF